MLVAVLAATLLTGASSSGAPVGAGDSPAGVSAPRGTSVDGLTLDAMSGARDGVYTAIHVLTFSGPQYSLEIGLANHAIDGGLQTPSAMCRATAGCVAAVNGDFFDVSDPGQPVVGDEVGGIIRNCVLLHTPEIAHEQVNLNEESVTNGLNWSSSIEVDNTSVAITGVNQELPMSYLGVHLPLAGVLLFTSLYHVAVPSAKGRVTYEFAQVDGTKSPTTINSSAELRLVGKTDKAVRVPSGDVYVSAPFGTALSTLAVGGDVALTVASSAGCNSVGGHPILLDQGVVGPISRADTYMAMPYARTVIGWTSSGETVVMSVGGVDAKTGATMFQLVTLLYSMGVVTALDLDGGESTSLYADGRVVYPSASRERPVSTALLVVHH